MSIIDEKGLSNLSYTNKDFNAIYVELLDLVKKLSYKWDPSVSDEGDPGVVLIKLAALLGDKLNYNIDKNVLELFPTSVSQLSNARKLFDQCGYSMKYYNSASSIVSLTMVKEPEDATYSAFGLEDEETYKGTVRRYKIPRFTMVANSDNSCVYTLIEDALIESTGKTVEISAIQGTLNDLTVNGETLITLRNLDDNNKLYLPDVDVAENGIFISNDLYGYDSWYKSDNLLLEPLGKPCYRFGVSDDGASCYIEFPSDIDNIIGNGLSVKYIRTSGYSGNIGRHSLRQFFQDVTSEVSLVGNAPSDSQQITTSLSAENVYITNIDPASDGRDPETIQDAYKSCRRLRNVLQTLVTTKDFSNFLIEKGKVSNCVVCDRSDDAQSTYSVMEVIGDAHRDTIHTKKHTVNTEIKKVTVGVTPYESNATTPIVAEIEEDEMSAFDLRIYALQYVEDPTTSNGFEKSFLPVELVNEDVYGRGQLVNSSIFDDINLIQHDYKAIKLDEIFMIKNKYPIVSRIIPYNKLTEMQKSEVLFNVYYALYDALNATNMEFGSPVQYDVVYDSIMGADNRIKAVVLEDIKYETYAVYVTVDELGNRVIKEDIRIDTDSYPYRISKDKEKKHVDYYYVNRMGKYEKCDGLTGFDGETKYYRPVFNTDTLRLNIEEATEASPLYKTYYTKGITGYSEVTSESLSNSTTYYEKYNDKDIYLRNKFRTDVFARSIVAGRTYLYEPKEAFSYSVKQTDVTEYLNVKKITTNASLTFTPDGGSFKYTVGENENIVFTQPNLIQTLSNGGYVKYFYNFRDVVPANSDYEIQGDEALILFWKDGSEETDPYKFSYYGKGSIISPTFSLTTGKELSTEGYRKYKYNFNTVKECVGRLSIGSLENYNTSNPLVITGTVTDKVLVNAQYSYGENAGSSTSVSRNEYIAGFSGSPFVTTGTMQINIKNTNKVDVTNSDNGVRSIQWILNTTTGDGTECVPNFVSVSENEYVYSMHDGEYLIYSNETHTQLVMLGRGTKITVTSSNGRGVDYIKEALTGRVISYESLMSNGASYITENGLWVSVPSDILINATEMKYNQIGPGQTVVLTPKDATSDEWYDYSTTTLDELPEPKEDKVGVKYKVTGYVKYDNIVAKGISDWFNDAESIDGTDVIIQVLESSGVFKYYEVDEYHMYSSSISGVRINSDGTTFLMKVTDTKYVSGERQTPVEITIEIKNGNVVLEPGIDVHMPIRTISFSDFDIEVGGNEMSGTNSDELSWDAYSILNISCSYDDPQRLKSNHTVTFLSDGKVSEISGDRWLSSLYAVDVTGGENVTVEIADLMTGSVITNDFCSFKVDGLAEGKTIITDTDLKYTVESSDFRVNVDNGCNECTVDIQSLTGGNTYIGKVEIHEESGTPVISVVGVDDTDVTTINAHNGGSFIYFCIADAPYKTGESTPSVKFRISDTTSKASLVIYPLVCVGLHPMVDDSGNTDSFVSYSDLITKIAALDTSDKFDFTYSIPDSQLIKNPLDSNSFLNINHIMNPYTICQLQMSSTHSTNHVDILVTDKIK